MSLGFGTSDLVFVPADGALTVSDAYNWRRIVLPVRRASVRISPSSCALLGAEMRDATARLRSRGEGVEAVAAADAFLASVRASEGAIAPGPPPGLLAAAGELRFWLRLGDTPQESFFEEDYEPTPTEPVATWHGTYGTLGIKQLGELEVALPGDGAVSSLALGFPAGADIVVEPMPFAEPLPLVHEFCGALGVSSRGQSVNIGYKGALETEHKGCAALTRLPGGGYATFYFHYSVKPVAEVMARITPAEFKALEGTLRRSHFVEAGSGPSHAIFERAGDWVHLYIDLEGREADGASRIPPFALVAAAGGGTDPAARAMLLGGMLSTVRPSASG